MFAGKNTIKKALYALIIALILGIIVSIYQSVTAKPEIQAPITTLSQYKTDEVNLAPDRY